MKDDEYIRELEDRVAEYESFLLWVEFRDESLLDSSYYVVERGRLMRELKLD